MKHYQAVNVQDMVPPAPSPIARNDAFGKALVRFRDGLTDEQRREFQTTTLDDVRLEMDKIRDRFGTGKKLRNMKRLSKFLEAMSQLEQVVTVFLNVHETVAFVWVRGAHSLRPCT